MRRISVLLLAVLALVVTGLPAGAQSIDRTVTDQQIPDTVADAKLASPRTADGSSFVTSIDPSLEGVEGPVRVIAVLNENPVAAVANRSASTQRQRGSAVEAQQAAVIAKTRTLDANLNVLGSVSRVLNAVFFEIDGAVLEDLAADTRVLRIDAIRNYELDLNETVPYVGATDLQDSGYDGSGVSVAVLDSGIDYTHSKLGGSGNPADYAANDPTIIEPGTFPTAKVVGGYDFTGSDWPNTDEAPDPDPLDDGPQAGHGTHVADIIGGLNGVAPAVDLYAVKVCSSVSTSCSGLALIQGMDFAADPNMDGSVKDHVDIVNMSLGSLYGQPFDDDLSQAVENATQIGILTVASAGNSADKPFVTGSPAASPSAISVAQTHVPSAILPFMVIDEPASIAGDYEAVFQTWSGELTAPITAPVQYADGAGGNLDGCTPFAAGSLTGLIVLVDRGGCFFSTKIQSVEAGGGLVGIIGLVAPGAPFPGGFGEGEPPTIPGYMISQADSNAIKGAIDGGDAVTATFDPANGVPLVGSVVGSSSRGPSNLAPAPVSTADSKGGPGIEPIVNKPDIGAPGASLSAEAGTGTEETAFGGTSGAAPMVSGSAALLMQAHPNWNLHQYKARLVQTANTHVYNAVGLSGTGGLAPISRVGGGELDVAAAAQYGVMAYDKETLQPTLNFGWIEMTKNSLTLRRVLKVKNYTNKTVRYSVTPEFRFADDEASGAVTVSAPSRISLRAGQTRNLTVSMEIDATKLPDWALNSGSAGASGAALTAGEFDGYLTLESSNGDTLNVPWVVVPRKAGNMNVSSNTVSVDSTDDSLGITLPAALVSAKNAGSTTVTGTAYSLLGQSGNLPQGGPGQMSPTPDLRSVGVATIPVPAGFCSADDSFILTFGIATWERQTHANAPLSVEIWLDTTGDDVPDYLVLNRDLTLNGLSDGRNVAWAVDLATGDATAFFFTNHLTVSGSTELFICGEQIGMNASNFFDPVNASFIASDFYFGGPGDAITDVPFLILGERYLLVDDGAIGFTELARGETRDLSMVDFGPVGTNPGELGLLIITDGGPQGPEAIVVKAR